MNCKQTDRGVKGDSPILGAVSSVIARESGRFPAYLAGKRRAAVVVLAVLALAATARAAGPMDDLARPQEGRSMRITSTMRIGEVRRGPGKKIILPHAPFKGDLEEASNFDNFTVDPGETHVLMDEQGPGVITHIWLTFLSPEPQDWAKKGSANHQEMMLRIYWDGSKRPAVEAPVGEFFANCFGKRSEVISLPVIVHNGEAYNCYWRMPFRKSARVEIENQSDKPISLLYYNLDWIKKDKIPDDTPYFYAQYRQEYPAVKGKDYLVLETKGKGHYVGTVMAVRTRSPSWFGEGDEKIYIDGEKTASVWGTGTEDYFNMAWGLKKGNTPYFGVPLCESWSNLGGHISAYRWHVNDPLVFNTGIKVTFEHFGWAPPDENPQHRAMSWNEREDDYATVAFWYQTGEPTFTARAPHARERRLPSLERLTVRGEDFTAGKYHGAGGAATEQLDFYEGKQLSYAPKQAEGAWLEIPFEVKKKEPLRLLLNMTKAPDYGKYQAYLNGVKLQGEMDFYSEKTGSEEFPLLDFWPAPGVYTLRLQCTGKSVHSEGYRCGLESVRLRERRPRVAKMAYDKDLDWKKDPRLYE
jgi:hypothetical protein